MVDYSLKYTEGAGKLFTYVGDHVVGNNYSVPGLTGCMGIICIPGAANSKFFLGHSKSDPHNDLKIKLEDYIDVNEIVGSGTIIIARWLIDAGQREWITGKLHGVDLQYLGSTGPLYSTLPVDHNDDTIVGVTTTTNDKMTLTFMSITDEEKEQAYESANLCSCCHQNFSKVSRWKYRCKSCNGIMCDSCSANGIPYGRIYTRICTNCNITKGPGKQKKW